MRFRYVVEVEVERDEGKFASRDELGGQIQESLEGANPDSLEGDEGGSYSVVAFEVNEEVEERGKQPVWVTPAEQRRVLEARSARKGGRA